MGVRYLAVSAVCTMVSVIGLQCWAEISVEKFKADGLIGKDTLYSENASLIIELLLRSHAMITLLAICVINTFVLFILSLKTIFFGELYATETRKLLERLANYVIYKGTFLPLIIPPAIFQATLWLTWLTVLCFLKMFQALARDRLERLNASPSATPGTYFRVYSALLLVLAFDFIWIWFCVAVSGPLVSSTYWLLFFEPLSIAFETLQAIVVHGFQLMDIWLHHSAAETTDCQRSKFFDSTAGSLWEWKSNLVRNMGFFLDMMTLLMALGHYVLIWWLHGMTFHLVDAILFLNIRALLSAVVKRIKGFIKLKIALGTLHEALPDAAPEEIQAYDDECAICREPMAKAKKLPCNHLYHLACLRSWLDQGLSENYSCPTCRKPLFVGRSESDATTHTRAVSSDEQLARQLSSGLDRANAGVGAVGVFPDQNQNAPGDNAWRGADSSWLQPWPGQGLDGAGPSTAIRSAGLGRVQLMMRHLASVGETYAQTALEDSSWGLWPASSSQAPASSTAFPPAAHRYPVTIGAMHRRTASHPANDNIANLLAMAETVREVLPHIPDEMIFQDLQQTNSVAVTVNNLLQM
ncbi:E3 ubiquitin protein ligase RIN2-like [Amaranthus tricolor]|uniref:E3 ubiquitin protein ligase RIN2-like n=1 Tax=Amaranthus tricolor TaxID=29722 RepID=UPI00258669CF|nr:E3 ubiquitin protein ligase RIN2-like [Amaranthus tricolor]XP_057546626.1 E3 ubiquitin protein ligase RIN2-like [Amaranthus tricolor]